MSDLSAEAQTRYPEDVRTNPIPVEVARIAVEVGQESAAACGASAEQEELFHFDSAPLSVRLGRRDKRAVTTIEEAFHERPDGLPLTLRTRSHGRWIGRLLRNEGRLAVVQEVLLEKGIVVTPGRINTISTLASGRSEPLLQVSSLVVDPITQIRKSR